MNEQLKNLAIENNPDLKAAQIKTSIAKEEINKANANFLPQVSGIVSWSRQNSFSVNTVNDFFQKRISKSKKHHYPKQ